MKHLCTGREFIPETSKIEDPPITINNQHEETKTMSFFSNFLNKAETDFQDIENLFKKLFKNEPSWAQVASADIAYVAPIIETILALFGQGAIDATVTATVAVIQTDLVLATKFIQALDSSKNLTDVLEALKANFLGLLQLAAIKNSDKVSTITAYVNGVVAEIEAIIAAVTKVNTAA